MIDDLLKKHPELGHIYISARPKVFHNDINVHISGTIKRRNGWEKFEFTGESFEETYNKFKKCL